MEEKWPQGKKAGSMSHLSGKKAKSEALEKKKDFDYGKPGSARLKHHMRASHKWTEGCCGTSEKEGK